MILYTDYTFNLVQLQHGLIVLTQEVSALTIAYLFFSRTIK